MNSLKSLRDILKKLLEAEAARLREDLSKKRAQPESLDEDLGRFEKYWKTYKALQEETSRKWLWPVVLAVICLVIATLLAAISRGKFFVTVDLETDALVAVVEKNWRFDGKIQASRISAYNLDRIEAPGLMLYLESPHRGAFLDASGGHVTLEDLELRLLPAGLSSSTLPVRPGRFEIQLESGQAHIFVSHCSVLGRLRLDQAMQLQAGDSGATGGASFQKKKVLVFPEPLELWSAARGEIPVQILISPSATWNMHDLKVRRLHFSRERLREAGAISFESAISKGAIYLREIKKSIELRLRDQISIAVVETESLDVEMGKTMKIHFSGWVKSVLAGPHGFEDELAPSWLEYIYHQEPWAIFWAAIVFLWSLGWGIKMVLGR